MAAFGQVRGRLSDLVLSFFLLALTRHVLLINLLQGRALEFRTNPETVLSWSGLAECPGRADGRRLWPGACCAETRMYIWRKVRLGVKSRPTSYGSLGRLFSEAQFPYLESGDNNSTYFIELLGE